MCVYTDRSQSTIHLLLPVFVYESVEGHAVLPAGGEVRDVDAGISAKTRGGDGLLRRFK